MLQGPWQPKLKRKIKFHICRPCTKNELQSNPHFQNISHQHNRSTTRSRLFQSKFMIYPKKKIENFTHLDEIDVRIEAWPRPDPHYPSRFRGKLSRRRRKQQRLYLHHRRHQRDQRHPIPYLLTPTKPYPETRNRPNLPRLLVDRF